jgi:hypothetical protein
VSLDARFGRKKQLCLIFTSFLAVGVFSHGSAGAVAGDEHWGSQSSFPSAGNQVSFYMACLNDHINSNQPQLLNAAHADRAACGRSRSNSLSHEQNRLAMVKPLHKGAHAGLCSVDESDGRRSLRSVPLLVRTRKTIENRINPQPDVSRARRLRCGSQRHLVVGSDRTSYRLYHGATPTKAQGGAG